MYIGQTPYDHPWDSEPLPEPTAENLRELEREIRVYLDAIAMIRDWRAQSLVARIGAYSMR